jgi:hypothetical protein
VELRIPGKAKKKDLRWIFTKFCCAAASPRQAVDRVLEIERGKRIKALKRHHQ